MADPRSRRVDQVAILAAAATVGIAALVLMGWALDIERLKGLRPTGATMKANTALGFLLAGASLLLLRGDRPTRGRVVAARSLATMVAVLGALTLLQDVFGWSLGVDDLLVAERGASPATSSPGRMAPVTALAFVLIGAAVLLRIRPGRRASEGLAIAVAALGYLVILGYVYGTSYIFALPRTTAMAVHTAIAFILLSVSILCARPHGRLIAILISDGLGGHLARGLLPAAVLIPTILGGLRLVGEEAGLYDTPFGTAALVAATVLLMGGATWWSTAALDRIDAQRLEAMRRTEAESKARDVERRRLRAVLDVLPVGVFLADAAGRIQDINEAARAIWGQGAPLLEAIPAYGRYQAWWADSGEPVTAEDWGLARSLTHGDVCTAEEVDIQAFDGQRRTILNYAAPFRDDAGAIAGGVAVNVDITRRKEAEAELRDLRDELEERVRRRTAELAAANAELEAFSYSVSHDLRAPLRWVDGFTQALAEEYAGKLDDVGRDYVRQIRESVQRMSDLIDALLRLTWITRAPLEQADVDLSAMARDIAFELEASEARRRVTWEIAGDVHASGDPKLLHVVLDNLLRNAWKFTRTREVARIQVGVTARDGEEAYFVRDNGVGFDMAYVDKLFRSFERLHRVDEFEGTGIGLALVRRVVQRHGGRTWAEGRLDDGATFYFTLGVPRRSE